MIDLGQALFVGLIGGGIGLVAVLLYLAIRAIIRWVMNNPDQSKPAKRK